MDKLNIIKDLNEKGLLDRQILRAILGCEEEEKEKEETEEFDVVDLISKYVNPLCAQATYDDLRECKSLEQIKDKLNKKLGLSEYAKGMIAGFILTEKYGEIPKAHGC